MRGLSTEKEGSAAKPGPVGPRRIREAAGPAPPLQDTPWYFS